MTNTPSPTDEDRELIERARGHEALLAGYATMLEKADDIGLNVLGNDLRDVQATLESLLSDRAKLEEALLDIRNRVLCPVGPSPTIDALQEIASTALTGRTDHTP